MKTKIISFLGILTVTLGSTQTGGAQTGGTVHFGNDSSCLLTNSQTAAPVLLASNIKAALYWSPLGSNTFSQIGASVSVGNPLPGIFSGGTRTNGLGTAAGGTGQFQVRAWGGGHATYEQAAVAPGALIGQSGVLTVITGNPIGDPPTPPASLVGAGLQGFALSANAAAPLTLTCASNKTVSCDTAWLFDPPVTSGGCSNVVVAELLTVTTGLCPRLITRTWVATDSCSASNLCSQTVTVVDLTPPIVSCATNKAVACGSELAFDAPSASDTCSGTNVVITVLSTTTNGLCPQTATRIWLATDACGNTNICAQTITIADTTPPVLTCASNKTVACGTAWTFDEPVAADACGTNAAVTVLGSVTNGTCPQFMTRIWVATDSCGNTNTCSQVVTVVSLAPLTITCATNKIVDCISAWNFDPPVVSEDCAGTNISVVELLTATNSLCPLSVTRTWGVTNLCNPNFSTTCSQTVLVVCSNCPMLALTKQCPPNPVPPGGILNYSGTVTNLSAVALTNVIVVNNRPASNTLVFGPVTLAPGEGATFSASYSVPACDCGPIVDTLTANGFTPEGVAFTNALTGSCASANVVTPGDTNGDGIVDQIELNAVLANYWANSQWIYMTNPATLGAGNFQFALTNAGAWSFTVLVTTNFTDWTNLPGPAYPVYQFHDPEATNTPQRYYRLQWP